jgi:hypothetical protein
MQPTADPKLLPPPEMARGMPCDAAREVQGRLLTGLGQRGDRVLGVIICCGAHGARRYYSCAAYATACEAPTAAHLGCSRGKWAEQNYCARCSAANRIGCCCAAALLPNRAIPSTPSLHLTEDDPCDTADAAGCSPKASFAAGNVPWRTEYSRARGAGRLRLGQRDSGILVYSPAGGARGARRCESCASMHGGSRGANRCITRRFRGSTCRTELHATAAAVAVGAAVSARVQLLPPPIAQRPWRMQRPLLWLWQQLPRRVQ